MRIELRCLLVFALYAICFSLGAATATALSEDECGYTYPDTSSTRWSGHPLPAGAISQLPGAWSDDPPVFIFEVDWNPADYGDEYSAWPWPLDSLIAYANEVAPDDTLTGFDPMEHSLAHRVVTYFGKDLDNSYPGIELAKWTHNLTQFTIQIIENDLPNDEENTSGLDWLRHQLPEYPDQRTVYRMAHDGFAHEWQHVVYQTLGPLELHSFALGTGTSEFCSQGGEHLANWTWVQPTDSTDLKSDLPYTRAPVLHDYYYLCMENWGSEDQHRHQTWGLLAPYFMHHCDLDVAANAWIYSDLLYDWLRVPEGGNTRRDLYALSGLLGNPIYDEFFVAPSTDGNARVRELFQNFAIALWVNSDHLTELPDSAGVWAAGAKPQETHGYLQNWNMFRGEYGGDCYDDARSRTLYNYVTTADSTFFGPVFPRHLHDIDDYEDEDCASSESSPLELQLSSYAHNILPFIADESIVNGGRCYELRFNLVFEDEYNCPPEGPGRSDYSLATDNDCLKVFAFGYEAQDDALDIYGSEAELLYTWEGDSLYTKHDSLCFAVPCFGSTYKSVAFLLTLTETEIDEGYTYAHILPYHYSFKAVPGASGTISENTTWPEDDLISGGAVCLNGTVTITSGDTLRVLPGTTVWCANADSIPLVNYVGFDVSGGLQIGAASADSVYFTPLAECWDGITVASGGSLDFDTGVIEGVDAIACETGATLAAIGSARIQLAEDAGGIDVRAAGTSSIDGCEVLNGTEVFLGDTQLSNTIIRQASPATTTAVTIEGDASLADVKIYDAHVGVNCIEGTDISLTDVSARSGPADCGRRLTYGLIASESSDVEVTSSAFEDFCVGIRAEDTPSLKVRTTMIADAGFLGAYLASSVTDADFGVDNLMVQDPGENCIVTADTTLHRVHNASSSKCPAEGNYWGTAAPTSAIFQGLVDWNPYETECPGSAGGPDLFIGQYPLAAAGRTGTLSSPYPNPFNPSCTIGFSLPNDGSQAEVCIYEISGRRIASIFAGTSDGREHRVIWDGRDGSGQRVSSGVYFVQLRAGKHVITKKTVMVK